MPDNNKARGYHHGELRNTLITAAWDTIHKRGIENFTIVDIAQQAQVSRAAPYRHFKDREALIDAVVNKGFAQLAEEVGLAVSSLPAGSTEKVIAGGLGYLRFFRRYPVFFELMFRIAPDDGSDLYEKQEASRMLCMKQHVDSVSEWCRQHNIAENQVMETAVKLWATVHGMVSLSLNHGIDRVYPEADMEEMLRSFTTTFFDGVKLTAT